MGYISILICWLIQLFQWIITIDLKKLQDLEDNLSELLAHSLVGRIRRAIKFINRLIPSEDMDVQPHADRKRRWAKRRFGEEGLPVQVHRQPVGQKASRVKVLQKLDTLQMVDTKRKLHFTLPLKDIQSKQGIPVNLTCSVTGFDPIFRWFKDSRPLSCDEKNCVNLTKGVIGIIRFTQLTPQDSGEYKCVISNNFGEIETKCYLEVLPNPEIPLVRPRFAVITDYYVYQFDELFLEARVDSAQTPEVFFYKDGKLVDLETDKYSLQIEDDRYKLVISHPDEDDNGIYVITAKNDVGTDKGNHRIEFKGREHHKMFGMFEIQRPTHRKRIRDPAEEKIDKNFQEILERRNRIRNMAPKQNDEQGETNGEPERKLTRAERIERDKEAVRNQLSFEATLKDVVALEGSTVKFICSVTGPDPNFKWSCNGEPLNFTKTCKNNSKLSYGSIIISEITARDGGTYECEAYNKHCSVVSEAHLIVIPRNIVGAESPTFTRAVKEYYNLATDDIILEVRVRGVPKPRVTWIKDCLEVENPEYFPEGKYICMREPNGVFQLAIHDPQRGDSGRYICQASNAGGKSELDHYVRVLPKSEYSHVRGITYVDPKAPKAKDHYRDEEEKLERSLECARAKKEVLDTLQLAFNATQQEPAMQESTVEEAEPKKPAVPENPKFAINLITSLRNLRILEGSQARMVCSIDGYNPSFKWLKDDEPLEQTTNVKNLSKDTIGCVSIGKVSAADGGVYTCIISNRYCEISTTCRLEVLQKPEIRGEPPRFKRVRHYYDQQTDQLILELLIDGQPFTEMLWYKDCREIVNDNKYLIGREPGGIYKLYVHKPIRRDCGTYMIQVENEHGMETHKHEIDFWSKNDFVHANRCLHADPKNKWKKIELVPVKQNEFISSVSNQRGEEIKAKEKHYRPFEMPPEKSRAEKKKEQYKLEFITTVRNYTVPKGTNIKLTCCASDSNRLKATWTKNGEPIETTTQVKVNLTKEGICTLEITNAALEDCGEYECHIKTPGGEASCKSKVTVYEIEPVTVVDVPPILATTFTDYYREKFNDIVIECKIRGSPRPRVIWFRDGLQVEFNGKYEFYHKEDGTCQLIVSNPKLIDNGKYIFKAMNSAGMFVHTYELDFEGRKVESRKKRYFENVTVANEATPRVYPKPKPVKERTPSPAPEPEPSKEEPESTDLNTGEEAVLSDDEEED